MAKKPDDNNFLAEELGPRIMPTTITYSDGFRFGFGFAVSLLLVALLLGVLTWLLVAVLHIH